MGRPPVPQSFVIGSGDRTAVQMHLPVGEIHTS
jgi:hypothetical protein